MSGDDVAQMVVEAIGSVLGQRKVSLHEPSFEGNEWKYVKECLDSTFVSSVGKYVDRFESDLATYTGAKHAVAVVNGTAALHVALMLAGVRHGDEVIVPALTFAATAAAVTYCGAIPHFADSDASTLGMNVEALRRHLERIADVRDGRCINKETGRAIKVIVPMHTFGHPVDIVGLLEVAERFSLQVVEDAAESLGSTVTGRHTGTFGAIGTLSFNGNKTITTGGGGAILTDSPEIAARAKHLTTTAKVPHQWEYVHDAVGYNYRLPNINAALGCAQLERMPQFLQAKRRLFEAYRQAFATFPGGDIFAEPPGCSSNYWLQTLVLRDRYADDLQKILGATNAAGYMTRPAWRLMHELGPYSGCPRMNLPVAESLQRRIVNLPSSAFLLKC